MYTVLGCQPTWHYSLARELNKGMPPLGTPLGTAQQ